MQDRRLIDMIGHDVMIAQARDEYVAFNAKHPDGRPVLPGEYPLSVITSGRAKEAYIEIRYTRPDGSDIWLSVDGEAVRDTSGQLTGAVVAVSDITVRF